MDLSSKDFSLNFHGFEQDDPETVRRFTAFCEANFEISPDALHVVGARPTTVELAHGESHEELEALAKVLREIGARVEVAEKCCVEERGTISAPSTQELHRLFGHQREDGEISSGPSCPYPPLGRTLYLLTQSDGVFDRKRLRQKHTQSVETSAPSPSPLSQGTSLLILSMVSLTLGAIALVTAALLLKNFSSSPSARPERAAFQSRPQNEPSAKESALRAIAPTRTLNATARLTDFNVDLKVVASDKALSISSLTFAPTSRVALSDGGTIKRVMGDPTFLSESAPGEWKGSMLLSVFVDKNGEESHFTTPAEVSVRVNDDRSTGRAKIEVHNGSSGDGSNSAVDQTTQENALIRALTVTEMSLS